MYILCGKILLAWAVCLATSCWEYAFPPFSLFFSLPPKGLKKVRNPDRMYRSAVCYAGHGPPKSISDDTETNSKIHLLILHRRSYRPLAGQFIIHSSIHLFTSWFHPSTHAPSSLLPLPFSLLAQHRLRLLCWLKCLLYGISLSIAEVLSLTTSDCFRLGPGDQDPSGPREGRQASIIVLHAHFLVWVGLAIQVSHGEYIRQWNNSQWFCFFFAWDWWYNACLCVCSARTKTAAHHSRGFSDL